MAKKQELTVWTLPADLVIPFLAAVRLMERTANPAFDFLMRCNSCKQVNVRAVRSVKDPHSIIGYQCQVEECGTTIKFERKLDFRAPDFPARLKDVPESALVEPTNVKPKVTPDPKWIDEAFEIVMHDE